MSLSGKILVVDDNAGIRSALQILLPRHFAEVKILSGPQALLSTVASMKPDCVLLDMNFSNERNTGREGLYWLSELKTYAEGLNVVLFTAFADVQLAVEGMKKGAFDFIVKPWDNDKLVETLKMACGEKRPVPEKKNDMFWGESAAMKSIRRQIEKIAPTDATILITGENGTGKDVLAREIHSMSLRSPREMVAVDAGAIPETLIESELFGYNKGAFTDAAADHAGKFEQADGSTLFLDEIANMPLPAQAKLLRALQDRKVIRLGSVKPVPVDIRLICATNQNLEQRIADGSFREDLYYRLNTIAIRLPALRERPEDIVPLARIFLERFAEKYKRPVTSFAPDAEAAMTSAYWKGNVRELQNCVEKAVILSEKSSISADELQLESMPGQQLRSAASGPLETLDEAEERVIRNAVEQFRGNLSLVAKALNISRPTLYNKLKKYGI